MLTPPPPPPPPPLCVCVLIGGVGFDINCGVRLIRTNLTEKDVLPVKEQLAQVHCTCI